MVFPKLLIPIKGVNLQAMFMLTNGIKISMDKGRALDNIYIKRLWRSVKNENIYLFVYTSGKALYEDLDAY